MCSTSGVTLNGHHYILCLCRSAQCAYFHAHLTARNLTERGGSYTKPPPAGIPHGACAAERGPSTSSPFVVGERSERRQKNRRKPTCCDGGRRKTRHKKRTPSGRPPQVYGGEARIRTGGKGFAGLCLTTWPLRRICKGPTLIGPGAYNGADNGARTRDPNLGKVVLYQLSHVRLRRSTIRKPRALRNPPNASLFCIAHNLGQKNSERRRA